ncbi:hypothetical protein E1A91_A05G302100v1 [Gossypium mustelinum]|uniref:Prolamin-like domain-containing protein n=2 Tax=Gossypium TaxID=3633 RepID=A0A5J5VXM5_GOSBA|nr:hypothetical protein ES319_A05G294500v1 [Gossypium barbadense]TYJ36360.1 hypothetical protein E1A91_A05G302100v1 [Gossypium mustelinum]
MRGISVTLLVLVLWTSCLKAVLGCGCSCHCSMSQSSSFNSPAQQQAYVISQQDNCCTCLCLPKPNPPSKPKPQPPSEEPPTPTKPSPSSPKPPEKQQPNCPNPSDYCQVPEWAPYIVKYRTQCWCALENFRGCFREIWGAAFNNYMNVGKQCCEAFEEMDGNCHRLMFGRNKWFVYKLRQHCSQFY